MVLARMSRSGNVSESSVDLTTLIKPSTSISNLAKAGDDSRLTTTSTCEELYGPYPSSIPVPMVNKDGRTPSPYVIAKATNMFDLSSYPDHRDVGTPDEWIPRDGKLVRLTGRHPFNVEPPLSVHQKFKFITPTCLHYVRNHGACPNIKWEDHRLRVGGPLATRPLDLGMDDVVAMPVRELPVTLVCAGNRRKEQNMIRQTIGFNWGAGGVSTNVWKGVLLRDLLLAAGVSERDMAGKHVEFIGHEDLPNKVGPGPFKDEQWGKLVKYGTSVPLSRAMNPAYDILVAYEANGERLQPDHGYPVRLIIPGYIGGRMIKWLTDINVIEHESWNHYHYHDNRILPPHVTAEESLTGGWWYKPEYIFNELNINSAMTAPDHNEVIDLASNMGGTYEVGGYAYTGGGRRITRVETSTDGGKHWEVCKVKQIEKPTDHGMYWCWIWWTYDLPVIDLVGCKEIWCRAWDDANNTQPNDPTWNLMGMGNNQVFRIKVHLNKSDGGRHGFRFEHPTQPGQLEGGWMTKLSEKPDSAGFGRLLEQGQATAAEVATVAAAPPPSSSTEVKKSKFISMAEVRKHNREDDVWIVVKGKVYDCTEYLDLHPGGADSILINAGEDSTDDFVAIHSTKATKMLDKFYVGDLDPASIDDAAQVEDDRVCEKTGRKVALDPKHKRSFTLQKKTVLSRDSFELDFSLQTPDHVLGLPTGKHIFLSGDVNGEMVMRRYTPITSDHDVGCVKFVIKAYPPCERFPLGGKFSQHLDALEVGGTIDMRGPVGEFDYHGNGKFLKEHEECYATHFNMIAGGTGITPVMQIAAEILRNADDNTKISLVFGARIEGDLLCRATLDGWAAEHPDRFRAHYILSDEAPEGWKESGHSTGFVGRELFDTVLYPCGDNCYNLMCGPPIMLERGCTPNLKALGHREENIFSF
jgi:nitrate reductase (NAD(P)H)